MSPSLGPAGGPSLNKPVVVFGTISSLGHHANTQNCCLLSILTTQLSPRLGRLVPFLGCQKHGPICLSASKSGIVIKHLSKNSSTSSAIKPNHRSTGDSV